MTWCLTCSQEDLLPSLSDKVFIKHSFGLCSFTEVGVTKSRMD